MHLVLHGDDHSICQASSDGVDSISRGGKEVSPCLEDEGVVDRESFSKALLRLWPGLCDGYNLAVIWILQGIFSVRLENGVSDVVADSEQTDLASLAAADDDDGDRL